MEARAHIIVRGIVQGVGFRYFAARCASQLNLTGFARNLFNGDVEIEVEGQRSAVEEFITMVKVGPRLAHVKDIIVQWEPYSGKYKTFEIR
ncbi:MAG: acylphosphatase [Bacteroidetes bacterium]|nr:acylphosphatase [Bacteroidota bacterium]